MPATKPDAARKRASASPQQAAPDAQGGVALVPAADADREPGAPLAPAMPGATAATAATAVTAVPAPETPLAPVAPVTPVARIAPAATVVAATAVPKRPRAPARERTIGTKVAGQPAFVLHSYPYKETSLIIDLFTRDFGRVALIAKGAKRPHSQLRGVLQTFQPLSSSWVGKSELRTLTDAEWVGGMLPLEKTALLCGFYLNELLVKLLARDDAHPVLFDHYVSTLNQLAHNEPAPIVLRKFERALLRETGVSADLTRCTTTRAAVQADVTYVVDPERGPRPERASDPWPRVAGKTLLDMEREDYQDVATQAQSKQLMRFLVAHHLNGAPLNTRQILVDLSQL